jgi:hypothetical protein
MSNQVDTVNSGALATIIGIVALSTLGVALTVTALVRDETKTVLSVKDLTQENGVRGLRADQQAQLNALPSWVSKKDQTVSLPIERAMALTVTQVRDNPLALTPGTKAPEPAASPEAATGEGSSAAAEASQDNAEVAAAPAKTSTAPVEKAQAAAAPPEEGKPSH